MFSVNIKLTAECTSVGKKIDLLTKIRNKFLCLKLSIINFQNCFFTLTCLLKRVKQFKMKLNILSQVHLAVLIICFSKSRQFFVCILEQTSKISHLHSLVKNLTVIPSEKKSINPTKNAHKICNQSPKDVDKELYALPMLCIATGGVKHNTRK